MTLRMTLEEAEAHQRRVALERQEREGRQKFGGPSASRQNLTELEKRPREDREHEEQVAVILWTKTARHLPEVDLLFAIPNGGHRNKKTAGRMKAEGVKSGVPDLFLPVARHGFHGLFIEMKAENGSLEAAQKRWVARLQAQGFAVHVCFGREAAIVVLTNYLTGGRGDAGEKQTIHREAGSNGEAHRGERTRSRRKRRASGTDRLRDGQ